MTLWVVRIIAEEIAYLFNSGFVEATCYYRSMTVLWSIFETE